MKKLFATLMLITLAACTQPESNTSGMTCDKCPCCQKMMDGNMKMDGMQCPMMKGDKKDGMQCNCCKGTMDGMEVKKQPKISTPADHTAHH